MARMAAVAAVAASLALLCGCATSSRPAPLTTDEMAAFDAAIDDLFWESTGLDDSERPEIARGDYVSSDDLPAKFDACMAAEPQVNLDPGVATYSCNRMYPMSPTAQGYFSADELSALYDYFQKSLVPCLELHGFDVASAPPRPAGHAPGYLDWHPFWTLQPSGENPESLEAECPFLPSWARSE